VNHSVVVGIDNGLSGGLVALSSVAGCAPIWSWPMPIRVKTEPVGSPKKGKKKQTNEVNADLVLSILESLHLDLRTDVLVVLEIPGKHSPGVHAIASMWESFGAIRGLCEAKGIQHVRIAPQTWQSKMIPKCKKGDTKPAALLKAKEIWPNETWLRTPRCSSPHDGMIDAALIAEYARTHL